MAHRWILLAAYHAGVCLLYSGLVSSSSFRHMGCYHVDSATDGLRFNYGSLSLEQCGTGCTAEGYPFFSLRQGRDCLCIRNYGRAGRAPYAAMCNYTCKADGVIFLCGGSMFEDVYYAVDTDTRRTLPYRDYVVYNNHVIFSEARSTCVKGNGDLPITVNHDHMQAVWNYIKDSNSSGVWIGLYRDISTDFKWAGLTINNRNALLDVSEGSPYWSQDNTFSGDCVILLVNKPSLKVVSCEASYPFMCHQIPPQPTTAPPVENGDTTPAPTEADMDVWAFNTQITLYITLPIFILLFVGSCLLYAVYHSVRKCRRSRRKRARSQSALSGAEGVFEPDTKPLTDADRVENEAASPVTARDVKMTANRTTSGQSTVDSRRSTALPVYLEEEEPEIDFTKLAIRDILYVKMILGDEKKDKKKRKKIIIA